MYLYLGRVELRGLAGYMWLLGRRLYLKTGWRSSQTHFLGNLTDLLGVAARLRRLLPRPVDVRRAVLAVVKALSMAEYVARRCRDSPTWRVRTWELLMAVEEAFSYAQWLWPWVAKARRRWRLGL